MIDYLVALGLNLILLGAGSWAILHYYSNKLAKLNRQNMEEICKLVSEVQQLETQENKLIQAH